jgi:uncharacterized protein (DUF4213/DUF364 family)
MSVKSELLGLIRRISDAIELPPVKHIYVPEPRPHVAEHTEFGVIELDDGAAGLYYAWLGESQKGMSRRFSSSRLVGSNVLDIACLLEEKDDAARSLGMAAVNAVSQSVFRRAGFHLDAAGDSMGALALKPEDHLGMVGYFPSLVARLKESGIRVSVIERKTHFFSDSDNITIGADIGELEACNKILCTASTLLNDSIDEVLTHTRRAEATVIVGPTASFLPDPLFRRGVIAMGGTEILDAEAAIGDLKADRGLAASSRKFLIRRADYPGIEALLISAREARNPGSSGSNGP